MNANFIKQSNARVMLYVFQICCFLCDFVILKILSILKFIVSHYIINLISNG